MKVHFTNSSPSSPPSPSFFARCRRCFGLNNVSWFAVASFSIICFSLFSRFFYLDFLPLKYDESVNAFLTNEALGSGLVMYSPEFYHGPLVFYCYLFVSYLVSDSSYAVRFVAAVFSVATVLLPWFYGKELGRKGVLIASSLLAISPAFFVYGRVGFHESTYVFFQFWATLSLLRWFSSFHLVPQGFTHRLPNFRGLYGLGISFLGMVLTKETWTIWVLALVVTSFIFGRKFSLLPIIFHGFGKLWFVAGLFLVAAGFYTGWGQNWAGLYDFVRGMFFWASMGLGDGGHDKPWYYWLEIFLTIEPLTFLSFLFALVVLWNLKRVKPIICFFSVFALLVLLVYSVLSYKTPWCVLPIISMFVVPVSLYFNSCSLMRSGVGRFSFLVLVTLGFIQVFEGARVSLSLNSPDFPHRYHYVEITREFQDFVNQYRKLLKSKPSLEQKMVSLYLSPESKFPLAYYFLKQRAYSAYDGLPQTADTVEAFRKQTLLDLKFPSWLVISEFPIDWSKIKSRLLQSEIQGEQTDLPFSSSIYMFRITRVTGYPPLYVYYDSRLVGDFFDGEPIEIGN